MSYLSLSLSLSLYIYIYTNYCVCVYKHAHVRVPYTCMDVRTTYIKASVLCVFVCCVSVRAYTLQNRPCGRFGLVDGGLFIGTGCISNTRLILSHH